MNHVLNTKSTADFLDWIGRISQCTNHQVCAMTLTDFGIAPCCQETVPAAIASGFRQESVSDDARENFTNALGAYAGRMPIAADAWIFVADLALRLDASTVVVGMNKRLRDDDVLKSLENQKHNFAQNLLSWMRNIRPKNEGCIRPQVDLIYFLVQSGNVSDSVARNTFVRLCEIDPKNWEKHMDVMRDLLRTQAQRIRADRSIDIIPDIEEQIMPLLEKHGFACGLLGRCLFVPHVPDSKPIGSSGVGLVPSGLS
jgi:hypothetical protein